MSDPLSIAASIAGLAALTGKVFKTVIDYGKAVKDARMDVSILSTELRTLSGMLTNLSLLATSLEASTSNNFFSNFQLDRLKKIVKDLEVDLTTAKSDFEASKVKSALQKLKWPFSKDDMMKLVEEIRVRKADINLALSADTLESLIQCLKAQEETKLEVSSTKDAIKVLQEMHSKVQLNAERQKTYHYFLKINPQLQFETAQRLRNSRTGGWFINHSGVSQWMRRPNSRVWLTGIPGSGKTLLCGLLIERVLDICKAETILAFAFCDYKDPETQVLGNILSSLALQIALQKPEAFNRLQEYYKELHPASGLPRDVDVGRLTATIIDMCHLFPKIFLIVDGLDECINNAREITRGIAKLASSIPNLSIALFSRREVEITSELAPEYEEIEISAHTHDLVLYIDAEISKRPTLSRLDLEEREDIKETLISKAKGMFRWVTCQLDCLEGLGKFGRETALNELPPTLDESYDRILIKVMSKRGRNIAQEIVRNTLHWVCYDSHGLSIAQICEALSIALSRSRRGVAKLELVDEKEIMTYCSSLIRKNLEGDRFELAHFTVEEYLNTIDEESTLKSFRYSKADAERSLAQVSLDHILSPEFATRPVAEISEYEKVIQRRTDHPFYSYAAAHWPSVPNTHDDEEVNKLLKDLFTARKRQHLLNWLIHLCVAEQIEERFQRRFLDLVTFILRRDLTSLHVAAMICSSTLCRWLLSTGSHANTTTFSDLAPIHFAIVGLEVFRDFKRGPMAKFVSCYIRPGVPSANDLHATIGTLLECDLKVPAVDGLSLGRLALGACARCRSAKPFLALLASFPDECLAQDALDMIRSMFEFDDVREIVIQDVIQAIFRLDASIDKNGQVAVAQQLVSKLVRSSDSWDTFGHGEDQFLPVLIQDADFLTYVKYTAQQNRGQDMARLIDDTRFEQHFKRDGYIDPNNDPLLIAGAFDSAEVARALLKSKFEWLGVDEHGQTVWHVAARQDSVHVLQTLLELEDDVESCLRAVCNDSTPLGNALMYGCMSAATLLIGHCPNDPEFFQSKRNALECAVDMGSQTLFHELVSKGVSADTSSSFWHNTLPLHFVNNYCSDSFVQELVERYDKDHPTRAGLTAFQRYIRHNLSMHDPILLANEQLASRLKMLAPTCHMLNRTRDKQHIWSVFCKELAIFGNQPTSVSQANNMDMLLAGLVKAGIVETFEQRYHCSSMTTLFEEFRVLDFNAGNHRWEATFLTNAFFTLWSPSHILNHPSTIRFFTKAIKQNDYQTVRFLLNADTPVHLRADGIAPIEQACSSGPLQTFVALFEAAELALGDGLEKAGLDLLCRLIETAAEFPETEKHCMEKIRFALDRGLSADEKSTHAPLPGELATIMAMRLNRYDILDLLLAAGADAFAVSFEGWDITKFSIFANRFDLFRKMHDKISSVSTYDWKAAVNILSPIPGSQLIFYGCSVLHIAATSSAVDIMNYLFDNDLIEDVDTCTTDLYTPLHIASIKGDVETIKCLVWHGSSVNGVIGQQSRPIEIAKMYCHDDAVKTLRNLGAFEPTFVSLPAGTSSDSEFSDQKEMEDESQTRKLKRKRLIWYQDSPEDNLDMTQRELQSSGAWRRSVEECIDYGDLDELQAIFCDGRPVDCLMPICGVCDALSYAIGSARVEMAIWLLSIGAIPKQVTCHFHRTSGALHRAVISEITGPCLSLLLDKALESGYAWSDNSVNPLHLACFYGNIEMLELILDHLNANAERYCTSISPWKEQETPPNKAAMMKALTSTMTPPVYHRVADDWKDISGETSALHILVFNKKIPMAKTLINAGADVNSLNAELQTPLIAAVICSNDDCAMVESLLNHGAIIDHKDIRGFSAIAHAAWYDFVHVARLLAERGASLETKNIWHGNLMHISSINSLRCFIYFHQQGCDGKGVTLNGSTIFGTADRRILTYILNARLIPPADSMVGLHIISSMLLFLGTRMVRMLYRSLQKDDRHKFLSSFRGKPPYLSTLCPDISTEELHNALLWLLDEGADIEGEISEEETALIYACSLGRLELVRTLVRRGARLDYVDNKGKYHSAVLSAKQYPHIVRWLLVERSQDQAKLAF